MYNSTYMQSEGYSQGSNMPPSSSQVPSYQVAAPGRPAAPEYSTSSSAARVPSTSTTYTSSVSACGQTGANNANNGASNVVNNRLSVISQLPKHPSYLQQQSQQQPLPPTQQLGGPSQEQFHPPPQQQSQQQQQPQYSGRQYRQNPRNQQQQQQQQQNFSSSLPPRNSNYTQSNQQLWPIIVNSHNSDQMSSHVPRNVSMDQRTRQRNNDVGEPSRVLHMRNVTPDVTQLGIQNLAQNFGNLTHIVMLRQMNQALVEMESVSSAQQLVECFHEAGFAEIDGRRVYIRYSNHQTLTTTQQASRTLLVSMFNTQYDVSAAAQITPEIVHQIFSSYGAVQKIVVLPKNESSKRNYNRVQALVQFDARETAEHVKNILQGQPVTLGETITFTLDIQFSRMDEIKTNNPMTSLLVDEQGNTYRPQPQQHQQEQHSPGTVNSAYAAAPSQWS